jgi:23S rRNA pseudouridine955/2504/2580 synthase
VTADRNQPVGVRRVRAGAGSEGQRLDNFLLRELAGVPRSRVYRLLRRGEVRVNGKRKQADYRLVADDEVRLPPLREAPAPDTAQRPVPDGLLETVRAAIVHEDPRLLVLDKPAGLAVHGGSGLSFGAIEALRALRPEESLELVHRLDRDTSGCLLVARTRPALRLAHALLREGAVEKRYTALVAGRWRLGRKTIDAPVLTHAREGGERVVRVHRAGKVALSDFRAVAHFRDVATLMDVAIRTGRTHQIRVHSAFAGHPVAGDDKYGDREHNARMRAIGLRRMFLHASSIAFRWPDTGATFRAEAGLPAELNAVLARLREAPSIGGV